MFMRWVENKLIPVFKKLYPGKRMVLVADNAPYHHKRVIGSLGHLNKTQMVDLMVQHKVEWIDIPLVSQRRLEGFIRTFHFVNLSCETKFRMMTFSAVS